jgi:hypothetical protein
MDVLRRLDEEVKLPKGSDENFLNRLDQDYNANSKSRFEFDLFEYRSVRITSLISAVEQQLPEQVDQAPLNLRTAGTFKQVFSLLRFCI